MLNKICRVSGKPLKMIVDFGQQPLGNGFLDSKSFSTEYFYSMIAGFCEESKMFQLCDQPDPKKMFHDNYAFYSSTSHVMSQHFEAFSHYIMSSNYLDKVDPFVVELGCNDGIMLRNFAQSGIRHLGIEPSLNVAAVANSRGVRTCSEFFTKVLAKKIVELHGKADAFIAANVMCHIPDINSVVEGIKILLKPAGVIVFEDPYLGDVIKKTSYDQIYDEHVFLFSALSIKELFSKYGLELIDVLPQKTHGGSMRYVLAHVGVYPVSEAVNQIILRESDLGLDSFQGFIDFKHNVEKSKKDLISLLSRLKQDGKKIIGYGATSKSTTVLNFCGIGPELIDYICDTTPIKQGKYSPGVHIPVVPYEHFIEDKPDYAVLFAWNHSDEIMKKEKQYIDAGGKWIIHVPEVRIL